MESELLGHRRRRGAFTGAPIRRAARSLSRLGPGEGKLFSRRDRDGHAGNWAMQAEDFHERAAGAAVFERVGWAKRARSGPGKVRRHRRDEPGTTPPKAMAAEGRFPLSDSLLHGCRGVRFLVDGRRCGARASTISGRTLPGEAIYLERAAKPTVACWLPARLPFHPRGSGWLWTFNVARQ